MELSVVSNMDLLFPVDSSDSKSIAKADNNKGFASVLEKTKYEQNNISSNDNSQKLDKAQDKDIDLEPKEDIEENLDEDTIKNDRRKQAIDELLNMLNSIYQIILSAEENIEDVANIDIDSLDLKLEDLSNILNEIQFLDEPLVLDNIDIDELSKFLSMFTNQNNEINFIDKEDLTKLQDILIGLENVEENIVEDKDVELAENQVKYDVDMNEYGKGKEEILLGTDNNDEFQVKKDENWLENGKSRDIDKDIQDNKISVEYSNESKDGLQTLDTYINSTLGKLIHTGNNMQSSDFSIDSFQNIDTDDVIHQIVDKVDLSLVDDNQEVKIRLKPDILGDLLLKMELKDGNLTAKLVVNNYKTKELIETNLIQLREQMKDSGLEIKTFEVFVGTNEDFERDQREKFYNSKNSHKLNVKTNGIKELQSYDNNIARAKPNIYYEGQLNLLA